MGRGGGLRFGPVCAVSFGKHPIWQSSSNMFRPRIHLDQLSVTVAIIEGLVSDRISITTLEISLEILGQACFSHWGHSRPPGPTCRTGPRSQDTHPMTAFCFNIDGQYYINAQTS